MIKTNMCGSAKFVGKAGLRKVNVLAMLRLTLGEQIFSVPIVTALIKTDPVSNATCMLLIET